MKCNVILQCDKNEQTLKKPVTFIASLVFGF